jgi:hypothetical protein
MGGGQKQRCNFRYNLARNVRTLILGLPMIFYTCFLRQLLDQSDPPRCSA